MIKSAHYRVQCANCKEELPVTVRIDTTKSAEEGHTERQLECPMCNTQLTFQLNQPAAEVEFVLRSVKKIS